MGQGRISPAISTTTCTLVAKKNARLTIERLLSNKKEAVINVAFWNKECSLTYRRFSKSAAKYGA